MSTKIKYLIPTTFFLFIVSLTYGDTNQPTIDSLQKAILLVKGKEKVNTLVALGVAHAEINPQKTIEYGQQAIDLSNSINYKKGTIRGLLRVGIGYENKGELKRALGFFEQALTIARNDNIPQLIGTVCNIIGTNYYYQGDYKNAMSFYLEGLAVSEKIDDKILMNTSLNCIAAIHYQHKEYIKAIDYYQQGLIIAKALNNEKDIATGFNNIASAYNEIGEKDKVLEYLKKSATLAKKTGDVVMEDIATLNIGQIYLEEKEYVLAEKFISQTLESSKKRNDKDVIVNCIMGLGDMYFRQKKHKESISYYLESIEIIQKMEAKPLEQSVYNFIARNYVALKSYEKAYEYKILENIIRDSIFTEQKSKQIQELATKYETEKKEVENQFLKEQKIKSELVIAQKTKTSWILSGLLGLIGLMFYWFIRQKKLKTQLLEKEMTLLNENLKKEEIIVRQTKLLQQTEQQKNKLFTNIAHELQTPLNIIKGLGIEIGNTEQLSNSGYESLSIILKNSDYLSKTTNQILSFNLGEKNPTSSNFVLFSLPTLFQYILSEYQFLAKEKSITLNSPSFEKEPVPIYSDVEKIETILKNLLSNAIKYTDNGGSVSLEYNVDDFGYHQITISDNGKGIPKDELSTIFERYYQSIEHESQGGVGLGLAICKEYVTSLGGEIKVRSEQGAWTIFTIRFPKASDDVLSKHTTYYEFPTRTVPPKLLLSDSKENEIKHTNSELLIVEDNLDFCKFLALILEKDYHLVFVHNGQQAINYLEDNTPALIITDWMMPGMGGLELVKYLKSTKRYNHFPILMLTAKSLISDKLKALRVGIDDYLIKPIEANILKNRISNLLKLLEERQETTTKFPHLSPQVNDLELTMADQDWLIQVEATITPLIGDFNLNLETVARLNSTNTKQLGQRIKSITGLTTKKYIQELRYWEARRMLETGEYNSVKAVALSAGFKDTKNFSRRFKERFGAYPSKYLIVSVPYNTIDNKV